MSKLDNADNNYSKHFPGGLCSAQRAQNPVKPKNPRFWLQSIILS